MWDITDFKNNIYCKLLWSAYLSMSSTYYHSSLLSCHKITKICLLFDYWYMTNSSTRQLLFYLQLFLYLVVPRLFIETNINNLYNSFVHYLYRHKHSQCSIVLLVMNGLLINLYIPNESIMYFFSFLIKSRLFKPFIYYSFTTVSIWI